MIKIDEERWAAIRGMGKIMGTQDNLGTARPYLIVLQEKVTVPTCDGNGDRLQYYHCEMEHKGYDSEEELLQSAKDNGYEIKDDEIESYEVKDVWEDRNWFFTMEGYTAHVQLNKHNYRGEIRPYIMHMFRNPEMKMVWDLLTEIGLYSPKKEVEIPSKSGDICEGEQK